VSRFRECTIRPMQSVTRKQLAGMASFCLFVIGVGTLFDQEWIRFNPYVLPTACTLGVAIWIVLLFTSRSSKAIAIWIIFRVPIVVSAVIVMLVSVAIITALVAGYRYGLGLSKAHVAALLGKEQTVNLASTPSPVTPPGANAPTPTTTPPTSPPIHKPPARLATPHNIPAEQPQGPDVGMSFYIEAGNPRFSIFNSGGEAAQQPKYTFALGDLSNEYYPHYPSDPNSSQPLPIPTDKVDDYVKPHSYLGNFAVFNDAAANLIKSGDQIFGFVTISCLNCAGSSSYWLYWEVGNGGWYAVFAPLDKNAQLFKQGNLSRLEVDERISRWIPASGRIPLKNGSPWNLDLTQP
jgi:hypothetical protein